ncbi:retrovirus-related pol polyprotein from transposon TNT 1-94 [Tanacetum coccineum]|uniref:Retrovirus-related pol polyprotein from transposon TNT 1-94 n=1 Tax=Tanacetum coccineum TaxID=301880 RepID=A0ABQ4Z0K8_9ASTR
MSNSNTNLQTQSSNALHNAIMEAGSKDRPPMLAPGNYVQWKSRIKRYIDTKPNSELIHYCLQNPPYTYQWAEKTVPVAEGSSETTTERYMENYKNVSQDIRDQLNAEAEAIQIILTGIDNDIYSTVDACPNACEMWKAIERLKQDVGLSLSKSVSCYKSSSECPVLTSTTTRMAKRKLGYDIRGQLMLAGIRENVGIEAHYMYMPLDPHEVTQIQLTILDHSLMMIQGIRYKNNLTTIMCFHGKMNILSNLNLSNDIYLANKELVDKLKGEIEDFKTKNKSLESSNNHFKEANNELSKTNQLMFKDLDVNYASKVEIDCAKAKGDLMSYKIDFEKSSNAYTQKINDLNQTISDMKKELCAHQETISIMSQAKEAQIKLYKTREDKELDKVIALENKVKVLNDIVYKTGQTVQTMNMLNRNCKTSFAKPEFLKKAQRANPRLYDIGCYNDNLALMLAPDSDETIRLEKERRSKLSDLIRPFDYDQLNNLYDLFVPQREKSAEQHYFPKTSKMSHTSSNKEFSKESFRKQTTLLEKRMDESIPWDQKTRQPMAVPIRTSKPKHNVNQSVATFSKKTVATDSTVKKSRNITRKLYEQIVLFIVESGCSKHMTGNLKLLTNFVEKLGERVYYVEGLNHNLFSVGQFCDADLEVAFRKSTCYIRDLKGNDLLTGSHGTDLYSISLQDSLTPNPICLMAKATSSQAWLWHRHLSHLNFDTINLLSKNNIVNGLPKLKFVKDHLCSSCELGKAKRKSFHTKTTPSSKRRLQLLHMDLCGPMRVESINGKKLCLVMLMTSPDILGLTSWVQDEAPGVSYRLPHTCQRDFMLKLQNSSN